MIEAVVFLKIRVPKNFAKFMGKHLYHSLFFNKVAGSARLTSNFIKNVFYKFYLVHS